MNSRRYQKFKKSFKIQSLELEGTQTRVNKHSNQKKIETLQRIKEKGSNTEDRKRVFAWKFHDILYSTSHIHEY